MNNHSTMKRLLLTITLALSVMTVWSGCSKLGASHAKDFTHTGCATGTRTDSFYGDEPSLLTLKYENGDLRVIHTNAMLNCAIKERGITCKAYVEGDDIHCVVDYEKKSDFEADCICTVEEMTSLITRLQEGQEYTFKYSCLDHSFKPFTLTFNKGLLQIIDTATL